MLFTEMKKRETSPIGTSVGQSQRRRAAKSGAYQRELERLDPYERLARAVIRLRMERSLTQEQLATRIGTTASAISRLESGQHKPSLATLENLAHAYKGRLLVGFELPGTKTTEIERELVAI
jgi:ribosome-binding protein aMBF1 (putative translation factor)